MTPTHLEKIVKYRDAMPIKWYNNSKLTKRKGMLNANNLHVSRN